MGRPHRTLRDLADRLTNEQDRLRFLSIGDLSLEASVAACHSFLPDPVKAALGRLRTLNDDFVVDDLVTLVTPSRAVAVDLLDELVDRQMVHTVGTLADGSTSYRLHEAVRQFVTYGPVGSLRPDHVTGRIRLPWQAAHCGGGMG
ncbi:hypothetical protein [Streptomyces werraensis]|uniref:hypothetical protein n=1 Tax=Streptomyces werraensis TaxID=68284 RepID=UPI001CE2ACCC